LHIKILNRKDFVLKACALCISGTGLSLIESCKTKSTVVKAKLFGGKISVQKEELISKKKLLLEIEELPYPIYISCNAKNEIHSFYMKCTHRDYKVEFKNDQFYCNNHGSRFNSLGVVIEGPAKINLLELSVKDLNESYIIDASSLDV
jgi:Rieske Fe-S protein